MTGGLLAAIVLGGASFVLWGCIGWCRLLQEGAERGRRALVIIPASLLACVTSLVLLEVTVQPALAITGAVTAWADASATHAADAAWLIAVLWLTLCGALVAYVGARLFEVRNTAVGAVVFGAPYPLLASVVSQDALEAALPTPWPAQLLAACVGLALTSAAIGVRLARRVLDRQTADEPGASRRRLTPRDVAVVIPAHDEEQSLPQCLRAVTALVAPENVFVASDGSKDGTVQVAEEWRCNVLDIQPNGGKAQALQRVIDHFGLCERFELVLIADADSSPAPDYLEHALPLFDDPDVVAVAGHAVTRWRPHIVPRWSMFFAAYRTRLYRVLQAVLRYGMSWRHSNVNYIVPGFSSMYRTRVLPHLDMTAPGLLIEDFNMTFAIHHRRLGRIAYTPRVRSTTEDPAWFRDYWKQVRRWYLGFWQTVRHHGLWISGFWLSLGLLMAEMLVQSVVFVALPLVLVVLATQGGDPIRLWMPLLGVVQMTALDVALGVFVADYAMTAIVAAYDRKPLLLVYGVGFVVLRWVDAFLFLSTIPRAFFGTSDGRWVSPRRV